MGHYPLTNNFPTIEEVIADVVKNAGLTMGKIKISYRKSTDSYSLRVLCKNDHALNRTEILRMIAGVRNNDAVAFIIADHKLRVETDILSDRSNKITGFSITLYA